MSSGRYFAVLLLPVDRLRRASVEHYLGLYEHQPTGTVSAQHVEDDRVGGVRKGQESPDNVRCHSKRRKYARILVMPT